MKASSMPSFGTSSGDINYIAALDFNNDGHPDIVSTNTAFSGSITLQLGNGDGTFKPPSLAVADLGYDQGWRVDQNPRFVVDVTGDGNAKREQEDPARLEQVKEQGMKLWQTVKDAVDKTAGALKKPL